MPTKTTYQSFINFKNRYARKIFRWFNYQLINKRIVEIDISIRPLNKNNAAQCVTNIVEVLLIKNTPIFHYFDKKKKLGYLNTVRVYICEEYINKNLSLLLQ